MAFDIEKFGHRVRQARLAKGMTQTELADAAGLSVSFLGHIERGTRMASIPTLFALSEALDVDTDFLLKGGRPDVDGNITEAQRKVLKELRKAFDQAWFDE